LARLSAAPYSCSDGPCESSSVPHASVTLQSFILTTSWVRRGVLPPTCTNNAGGSLNLSNHCNHTTSGLSSRILPATSRSSSTRTVPAHFNRSMHSAYVSICLNGRGRGGILPISHALHNKLQLSVTQVLLSRAGADALVSQRVRHCQRLILAHRWFGELFDVASHGGC
jgi:hypothetical protein